MALRGKARANETRARAELRRRERDIAQVGRQMALENGRISGASASIPSATPPDTITDWLPSSATAPAIAAPSAAQGFTSASRPARSPARTVAISARASVQLARLAMASSAVPEALRSSQPRASSPRSAGSAQAQPKEAAAPLGPCTIRPSARTAEPMPVPIARRMTSDALRAAPSAASARRASWASLPSATVTPKNMRARSSPFR